MSEPQKFRAVCDHEWEHKTHLVPAVQGEAHHAEIVSSEKLTFTAMLTRAGIKFQQHHNRNGDSIEIRNQRSEMAAEYPPGVRLRSVAQFDFDSTGSLYYVGIIWEE